MISSFRRGASGGLAFLGIVVALLLSNHASKIETRREMIDAIVAKGGTVNIEGAESPRDRVNGNVEKITLRECSIYDEFLKLICRTFPEVKQLDVADTAITDQSVDTIAELSSLEELNVEGTMLTGQGVETLRVRMPAVRVTEFHE